MAHLYLRRTNLTSNTLMHELIIFVTALYMLYGHSAAQEIQHILKLPVVVLNLNASILIEISACPRDSKKSCSTLHHFSWST
jgi:hypothetical protein